MVKSSIMDFSDVLLFQEFRFSSSSRNHIFVKVPLLKCLTRGVKYKTNSSGIKYETEYITEVRYNAYDTNYHYYVFFDDSTEVEVSYLK